MKKERVANSEKWSVTFEIPVEAAAHSAAVVGDFNDWDEAAGAMKQRKDGSWTRAVRLAPGTYSFRYFVDGMTWLNDPGADGWEPSGFGEDNSLVTVG